MRIQCENCDATYTIDDAQLSEQPIGAQCPYCGHVKLVRRGDDAGAPAAPPAFGPPGEAPAYDPFGGGGADPGFGTGNPFGQDLAAPDLGAPPAASAPPAPSAPHGYGAGLGAPDYSSPPGPSTNSGLGYMQGPPVGGLASADLSSSDLANSEYGHSHVPGGSPAGNPFGAGVDLGGPVGAPFQDAPAAGAESDARCQVCGTPLTDEFDKVIGLCDEHQRDRGAEGGAPPATSGGLGGLSGDLAEGPAHWHVRRQGGGVEGPMALEDLRNQIRSGTYSVADEYSSDGIDFGPISRFKDIAYLASLSNNGPSAPRASLAGSGPSFSIGRVVTPVLILLIIGGIGFLGYRQRETLEGIYEGIVQGTGPSGPSTPNPLKRYLATWRLRHPDLSGTASEHLGTAHGRHLEDTQQGYQAAERAFERALLLDENNVEAIAGYVENLALWRYESATIDELRVAEAAANYGKELDPEAAAPHRALGALALAKGDLNGCRAGADGAIQRAATDGQAKLLLAGCYMQGNVQLAIDEAERAKQLVPGLRRADRVLAKAYAIAGRFTSAFKVLDQRLSVDPDNSDVHVQYGRIARQLADHRLAREHFTRAVALPGDRQAAMLALAELEYELGAFGKAASLYAKAARERAMHGARAARVYAGWASSELLRKRPARAVKLSEQALSFVRNHPAALLVRGQAALMTGSATTAAAYAARTMAVRAGEPSALVLKGRAVMADRQMDVAIRAFEEAITNDPRDARLKGILAALYLRRGGSPQAYALMRRAAEIDPLEARARNRVGLLGLSPVAVQEALGQFRKSAAEERNASVASSAMGMLYYHLGDLPRATTAISRALRIDGANSTALIYDAQLALDRDDPRRALKSATKLLAVERGSALGHLLHARALSAKGDFEKARREYDSALRSNPGLLAAKIELAGIALDAGGRDKAIEELLTAYRINPHNLRARQLLRKAGI